MKHNKIITILFVVIGIITSQLSAQKVTNVKATQQNKTVIVNYKVEGGASDRIYSSNLYYSTDGGNNYSKCKSTIAKYAKPNQTAQITWNVTNDIDYLGGSDIVFKVSAFGFWDYVQGEANIKGKTYNTIKIGQQEWMAENFAYKTSNGCWAYDNNSSNVSKYGYLYNWENAKKVAPNGWHLPTNAEWEQLVNYLGDRSDVGKKMKSTSGWKKGGNGSNSSGFSALPSGYRNESGGFVSIGYNVFFWSASAYNNGNALVYRLYYKNSDVIRNNNGKGSGYSVRLVRD